MRLLIVGCGDVGHRVLQLLPKNVTPWVLTRRSAEYWRGKAVRPLSGDLDDPKSLARLKGCFEAVLHLAPPPGVGLQDSRTRSLVQALSRGAAPCRFVYVSTTGVYGDHRGRHIDETAKCLATSDRAIRRVDAETCLRRWAQRSGVRLAVLRAPGIYAANRSGHPRERLLAGRPVLRPEEDIYTNHIHADDLAHACWRALWLSPPLRLFNVVDDSSRLMGDHYDLAADKLSLPRAPRASLTELEQVLTPAQMSFMRESRRIGNARMKRELRVHLRYRLPEQSW